MRKLLFLTLLLMILAEVGFGQFRNRKTNKGSQSEVLNNYANPREYEIASIDIRGLNILDKNALISLTGLRVGDKIKIPGDEISMAIRKLWDHGLVGDVTIEVEKVEGLSVYLMIELSELPRLTGFTFEGVSSTKESDLREDLNLYKGKVVTDAIIRNTELTVKKSYVSKGFLNTDVNVVKVQDTVNVEGVRLKIVVDKKSKVKIKNIYIIGNEDISDVKLESKMKKTAERVRFKLPKMALETVLGITPKKLYNFVTKRYDMSFEELKEFVTENAKLNFFKGSKYIKEEFENDKKLVIDFYNSKGYRDASILSDTLYRSGENTIDIVINVEEGNKYYFRDIDWTGNYIYSDETLDAVLNIKRGDVYNKELIDKKVNFNPKGIDISGLYMDDGYLFFRVDPVEVKIENDSIDIEMRIYEGDQATIRNVTFSGNDRTSDHVIRRELSTIPGQKFRRSDLIRTQQRLAQIGYFDPEQIAPNYFPNPADGTVDIDWGLVERSNDQIELSGGWGGYYGFVGTLGVSLNNFSIRNLMKWNFDPYPVGDGQRLSLRMQANGKQYQNYSFSFTEPWLGGKKPNSFTISLNNTVLRSRNSEDFDGDGVPDYFPSFGDDFNATIVMKGITLGLGKRLEWPDNYFNLGAYLSYQNYKLDNYPDLGQRFENGTSNNISLNLVLSRNSLDNPMYPKSGSSISISTTITPPHSYWRNLADDVSPEIRYKWIEYHKWMIDTKYYLNIFDKFVIEASAHIGIIGRYSKDQYPGPFERFWVGGAGLAGQRFIIANDVIGLRGYEDNSITPPFVSSDPNSRFYAMDGIKGGIIYDKFSLELRYPVSTSESATIYGFIFAEGGNNWYRYEEFNPFDMYRSAGAGVRVFMPAFGLIGINWAYGFDAVPGQDISGSQFHFTIGQQLR